jgi:outer membrane protein assembly factor BamB
MKIKRLLILLAITAIFISSCSFLDAPGTRNVFGTPIKGSSSDNVEPPGRYQNDTNMRHDSQVKLPSPKIKPVIHWDSNIKLSGLEPEDLMVDRNGNIWYTSEAISPEHFDSSKNIIKVNPDKTESIVKKYQSIPEMPIVMLCDDSTIIQEESPVFPEQDKSKSDFKNKVSFERIDFKGKTIWRTVQVDSLFIRPRAWRLSGNRFLVPIGSDSSGEFAIFSLENGDLLNTIKFPEWNVSTLFCSPLETSDGGWIGFTNSKIVHYDSKFNPFWEYKLESESLSPTSVLTPDNKILIGEVYDAIALDLKTGKKVWSIDIGNSTAVGITPQGNYLFSGRMSPMERDENRSKEIAEHSSAIGVNTNLLCCTDPDGKILWTVQNLALNPFPQKNIFCYDDNSILITNGYGIMLIDAMGKPIWEIFTDELGIKDQSGLSLASVNPAPDNRIVINFVDYNKLKDVIDASANAIRVISLGLPSMK